MSRRASISRILFLSRIALAVALGVGAILIVQDAWLSFPKMIRDHRVAWSAAGIAIASEVARRWGASRRAAKVEARAEGFLRRGLPAILIVAGVMMLATWLPHYLTWPWQRDADTFDEIAQAWDAGVLPYRDIRAYNFPGHIYLHWLLGKTFGWGRTPGLYAVDAGLLMLLGLVLPAWSGRRFGTMTPGLVGIVIFLTFYLSLTYDLVAEREGQTAILMAMALMAAEGWPGIGGWAVSAGLAAAALTIRPHAVLFLPAILVAVIYGARGRGTPPRRAVPTWLAAYSVASAIGFAPLFLAGIADDLIDGLRVATYGGPYSRATPGVFLRVLISQAADPRAVAALVLNLWLSVFSKGVIRDSARIWGLAIVAAIVYRPLHPVQHLYLILPISLFDSVAMAVPVAWLLTRANTSAMIRILGVAAVLAESPVGIPAFCRPDLCLPAISALAGGRYPNQEPAGCDPWFEVGKGRPYPWDNYVRLLVYLREHTAPSTMVANVLKKPPFPAINGPVGRRSPFRAESGICWMWMVNLDLDAEFAAQLDAAEDSVVVWAPIEIGDQPRLRLVRVGEVILRHYRFEARFGRMEVWRRMRLPPGSEESRRSGR